VVRAECCDGRATGPPDMIVPGPPHMKLPTEEQLQGWMLDDLPSLWVPYLVR